MSTNPYAQSPAGAPAPAANSEQQRVSDYELAVGPNNDYYLPKFEQFDQGGSKAGWHWPAFFATSPWFLYRKMYGPGVFILLYPLIALILCAIIYGILRPSTNVMIAIGILVFAAPWFLFPIYANALYWKHIKKVIRNVPSSFASQPDKRAARIERNGGTSVGPMIGILAGLGFFGIGGIGIMAAIAIPAYQDYTIRSQIYEGLNLASAPKAAVAEYYASNGEWPADSETAGLDSIGGKFVESVVVESGSIVITYGAAANEKITRQRLALQPSADAAGNVYWACGYDVTPDGYTPSDGPSGSDLPAKYLPLACRSGT
jgi:type IV pilus assembly protein PilA